MSRKSRYESTTMYITKQRKYTPDRKIAHHNTVFLMILAGKLVAKTKVKKRFQCNNPKQETKGRAESALDIYAQK